MRDQDHRYGGESFNMEDGMQIVRAIGAFMGIVVIVMGLYYVTQVFSLIMGGLQDPEGFHGHLEKWSEAVGGEDIELVVAGNAVKCANIVALLVLGGGAVVLGWLSMGLVLTGAKVLSWTLGDRAAIKKMLVHAFGPTGKPGSGASP